MFNNFNIFCENYQKQVSTDVDLEKSQQDLDGIIVPFQIISSNNGNYIVSQDNVIPLKTVNDKDYKEIVDLIKQFWHRGYAFGDYAPENLAYHNGKLKVLDLDSFQYIGDSGFNSMDELLKYCKKWFKR